MITGTLSYIRLMSRKNDINRETYNRIAEDWNKDHADDTWWIEGTDALVNMLPPKASVLDVGCGSGTKTKYLTKKGLAVTGVDLSENMIAVAQREMPGNPFYVADMHDLRGVPGEYDGVFVQAALLHVPKAEVDAVLDELLRKLKPGGHLYIAVKGRREGEEQEAVVTEKDYGYAYERFFSYFTLDELNEYFRRHELTCVYEHTETIGTRSWLQIIGRKQ